MYSEVFLKKKRSNITITIDLKIDLFFVFNISEISGNVELVKAKDHHGIFHFHYSYGYN